MGRLSACQVFLSVLLINTSAVSSAAETVFINDGASLGKYLCSPNGTISPNTYLVLNKSLLIIGGEEFCLIENTSLLLHCKRWKLEVVMLKFIASQDHGDLGSSMSLISP